jgi:intracellular sulfur oxidation DsrE/DsrF family protein
MIQMNADRAIRNSLALFLGLAILLAALPLAADQEPDNAAALAGLDSTRTVFLVNKPTAPETARYLKAIQATHESLIKQGVTPTTVIVFLGIPVQFITTAPAASIAAEQHEALESIAESTRKLAELGIRMEVCSAATKHFGVDNATLLPGMHAVGNGFISLIGWQSQGFVPMTF